MAAFSVVNGASFRVIVEPDRAAQKATANPSKAMVVGESLVRPKL